MTLQLTIADLPALTGSPGIAQGSYGDAGNLELVAPAADGGFWVFWFNADLVEHRSGAARGHWSGGLRVLADRDVAAARIAQVQAGPRFLEALALSDGELLRLYWTPADGFVTAGPIAHSITATSAPVESGTTLHVLAIDETANLLHLQGDCASYPDVAWTAEVVLTGATHVSLTDGLRAAAVVDGTVERLHHDGSWHRTPTALRDVTGLALAGDTLVTLDGAGLLAPHVPPARAVTAARTTIDGGRVDVVLATAAGLVHVHGDGTAWGDPTPIRSQVWAEPGSPVHRG